MAPGAVLKDAALAALAMVGTTAVVYVASWIGWFRSDVGYHRQWNTFHPGEGVMAAPCAAQLGEVPPGRLRLQHDAADPAPLPVRPLT